MLEKSSDCILQSKYWRLEVCSNLDSLLKRSDLEAMEEWMDLMPGEKNSSKIDVWLCEGREGKVPGMPVKLQRC